MNLTIGKLAERGGVGVETVRYYQRRGLMSTPKPAGGGTTNGTGRSGRLSGSGGIRRYGEDDLRRLNFIRSAQAAGFTLSEIGELLSLEATQDKARVRALALKRIAALDLQIQQMTEARTSLSRLAGQCHATMTDKEAPCPILSAFEPVI